MNHQIIYHIQEIMGLLPQLGGDLEAGKAFRMENNDSGLVVYISHLIRTILALHDLSESFVVSRRADEELILVENRIANAQQEIEDAKSPEERKAEEEKANAKKEKEKDEKEGDKDAKDKTKK